MMSSPKDKPRLRVDIDELHTSAIRAFELSSGLGFTDDISTIHKQYENPKVVFSGPDRRRDTYKSTDSNTTPDIIANNLDLAVQDNIKRSSGAWRGLISNTKEILLLLILYTIQGIPMGLSASIPFLLQGHVGYSELGIFSLVSLPFSCKVFWAPIVDSSRFPGVGRRKSWLIPVQVICGLTMIYGGLPSTVDNWMGSAASSTAPTGIKPNVMYLLIYFATLYFLMATQDIAVDGWSLTMLSEENIGFSSSCNAIGQTLGFSISHIGFLALRDPNTCNRWFRTVPSVDGMVTLGSFLRFWAIIVLITTVVAMLFPEEEAFVDKFETTVQCLNENGVKELELGVLETYKLLGTMVTVKPIMLLGTILLSCRLAFAPIDAATHLKLIEAGMTKEELAFFGPFLLPLGIVCPLVIGKLTSGPRPLRWFIRGCKFRLGMSFIWLGLVFITKQLYSTLADGSPAPLWFYSLIIFVSILQSASTDVMFSSQMSFFARISDPAIGGTYMTFLNTITNMGNKWPSILSLMTLDHFDEWFMGHGFIFQTLLFTAVGLLWLWWSIPIVRQLEHESREHWLVIKRKIV